MAWRTQRAGALLLAAIAALAAAILGSFWEFTADDAYIYMLYGENLVDTGELVFNRGERVSTMTSPLLGLLDAGLYALTGQTRLAYKVLSVGLLLLTAVLVVRAQPRDPWLRGAAAAVLVLSPGVLLWTVGGMETPVHMLVVAAATALALGPAARRPGRAVAVVALAGFACVCRQDAAPYMAGLSLGAVWGQRPRTVALAVAAGALLPLAWCGFAWLYYEDVFPTSFYVKSQLRDQPGWLATNAAYIGQFLLWTGALPLALWVALERWRRGRGPAAPAEPRPVPWGAWLGLALQLGYALTMATVHMMFAFRALVPYLPAVLLLVGEAARRSGAAPRGRLAARALAAGLVVLVALQVWQAVRTYRSSVQGFAVTGELQNASLADMIASMPVAERLVTDVAAHWRGLEHRPREHPRIWTWAEGIMPYTYREAYYFGSLISYRHRAPASVAAYRGWADYVLTVDEPGPNVIAAHPVVFAGRAGFMMAIYNPAPAPDALPPTVRAPRPE